MKTFNLTERYLQVQKAINEFSENVPDTLSLMEIRNQDRLSYRTLKAIDIRGQKLGKTLIDNFFQEEELKEIQETLANKDIFLPEPSEENFDIMELKSRYDQLMEKLPQVEDSLIFKFCYPGVKEAVQRMAPELVNSFFQNDELEQIKQIKKQDTIITPQTDVNNIYIASKTYQK